jgi:hypothetical protein
MVKCQYLGWLCLMLFIFSCDQNQRSAGHHDSSHPSNSHSSSSHSSLHQPQISMSDLKDLEKKIFDFYEQQKGIKEFFKTGFLLAKQDNVVANAVSNDMLIPLISMPCLFPENCGIFFEHLQETLHLSPYHLVQKDPRKMMRDEYQSVISQESYYAGVVYQNPTQPSMPPQLVMALRLTPEPFLSVMIHYHSDLNHGDLLSAHSNIAIVINPDEHQGLLKILSRLQREFFVTFQSEIDDVLSVDSKQIQAMKTFDALGFYDQTSLLDPQLNMILDLCENRKMTFLKKQDQMRLSDQQKLKSILHQRQIRSYPDFKQFSLEDLDEIDGMINFQGQAFVEFKPQSKEDLSKILEFLDKMLQKKVRLIRPSELTL